MGAKVIVLVLSCSGSFIKLKSTDEDATMKDVLNLYKERLQWYSIKVSLFSYLVRYQLIALCHV